MASAVKEARHEISYGCSQSVLRWFLNRTSENVPRFEELRSLALADLHRFTAWAMDRQYLLLRTAGAIALVDVSFDRRTVYVDYVPARGYGVRFHLDSNSLADLGEQLRRAMDRRRSFDRLFFND